MDEITARKGIPRKQQRLIFNGQQLHDGLYLSEHGISPYHTHPMFCYSPPRNRITIHLLHKCHGSARSCSKFDALLSQVSRPRSRLSRRNKNILESTHQTKRRRDRFLRIMKGDYKTRAEQKFFKSFYLDRPIPPRHPIMIHSSNVSSLKLLEPRSLYISLN